jgi:stress-induced morphogen
VISKEALIGYIQKAIPDASVSVVDRTEGMDHFIIQVVSDLFTGKTLMDRHRLVYQALNEPMQDGRIHAVEIKTQTRAGD